MDGLKEGVRKKLGYASDVPLQFAQLRDGKAVDLEDGTPNHFTIGSSF